MGIDDYEKSSYEFMSDSECHIYIFNMYEDYRIFNNPSSSLYKLQ